MPNDKIEEITHALEIGEKFDEHYAVHNSQVRYLLQLVEQQQAEIERHNRLQETMKESVSAVISESRKDIDKLQLALNAVTAEAREHLAALQQSREENEQLKTLHLRETERLRDLYERERDIAERLRGELESHESWKAISEAVQRELEQIKAERDDYRKVLEWYGGGSEDGGEKARDVILRYKRGDRADG